MQNQPSFSYPAPHGKRFVAFIIDTTLSLVATKILAAMLVGALSILAVVIGVFGPLIYFVATQVLMGATPGKKLMNLELISVETEMPPSLGTVIFRETLGRLIASITLSIGYLMILFTEDRTGLHDKMSKTRVVSSVPSEDGSSFVPVLVGGLGSIVAIVFVGLYVLLYTAVPLKKIATDLSTKGIQIDGLKGSLMQGISAESVAFENEQAALNAKDVVFTYQSILGTFTTGELHIEKISASLLHLNIKKVANPLAPDADEPEEREASKSAGTEKGRGGKGEGSSGHAADLKPRKDVKLIVDNIDIGNFSIQQAGKDLASFERLFVSGIKLDKAGVQLEKFWLNSKIATVNIERMSYAGDDIKIEKSSWLLRKELKPDLLVGDVDFQLHGSGNIKDKKLQVTLKGLRDSLNIGVMDQLLTISTKNLQPHWFVKDFPPLHSINVEMKGGVMELLFAPKFTGSYVIHNYKFQLLEKPMPGLLLGAQSPANGGAWISSLRYQPGANGVPSFKIHLSSTRPMAPETILGAFYFSKTADLTAGENETVLARQKFFDIPMVPAIPMVPGVPGGPEARVPASSPGGN